MICLIFWSSGGKSVIFECNGKEKYLQKFGHYVWGEG